MDRHIVAYRAKSLPGSVLRVWLRTFIVEPSAGLLHRPSVTASTCSFLHCTGLHTTVSNTTLVSVNFLKGPKKAANSNPWLVITSHWLHPVLSAFPDLSDAR